MPDSMIDAAATRVGKALAHAGDQIADVTSFKTGCAVIAPMFADVLEVDALVMSVVTANPTFMVHVDWRAGHPPAIIDSRETGFDEAIPEICRELPVWEIDYPDRLHVSIHVASNSTLDVRGLNEISVLLPPFLELSRRSDRLSQATSLLDIAMEEITARELDSVPQRIVERIGKSFDAPTAFYPASEEEPTRPVLPLAIYSAGLATQVTDHLFASFGQIPEGPVQRAHDSAPRAAPVTAASLAGSREAGRIIAMLDRSRIIDFVALQVVHQERAIGVMVSLLTKHRNGDRERRFTSEDIATLASSVLIAGWALPLAQQYGRARRALQESEMLRHVAITSFQHKDAAETLVLASGVAKIVFRADFVAVATIAADWTSSRWEHVDGNRTQSHLQLRLHDFASDGRDWFERPSYFLVQNVATDSNLAGENLAIHLAEGLTSSISVPFPILSGRRGFLMIGFREERQIGEDDVRFVRSMAQTIAAAL